MDTTQSQTNSSNTQDEELQKNTSDLLKQVREERAAFAQQSEALLSQISNQADLLVAEGDILERDIEAIEHDMNEKLNTATEKFLSEDDEPTIEE